MPTIHTTVDIDAPRPVIWDVIADLSSYPEWNPHIVRAVGDLRLDADLEISVQRVGAKQRDMTVTVTDYQPDRRLEWTATALNGWLFEGRHVLELEALPGNRTRLHNVETVSGILAPIVLTSAPERDYQRMNRALKDRVERGVSVVAR